MEEYPKRRAFPVLWLIGGSLLLLSAGIVIALAMIRHLPAADDKNPLVLDSQSTFTLPSTPSALPTYTALPSSVTPPATVAIALEAQPTVTIAAEVEASPIGAIATSETIAAGPTFKVTAPSLPLHQGPGERYPLAGLVTADQTLTVNGRTVEGDWWLVCCSEGKPGWLRLQPGSVLAYGDMNALAIYTLPAPAATATRPAAVAVVPTPRPAAPVIAPPPPVPGAPIVPTVPLPTAPPAAPAREAGPPIPVNPSCSVNGPAYGQVEIIGPASVRPAYRDPELNIAMRGWVPSNHYAHTLWDFPGDIDDIAPRLQTLFADKRVPEITSLYRVREWDWECNCPGPPIETPDTNLQDQSVTLTGFRVAPGEIIYTPDRPPAGEIGGNYRAMVLYVDADSITLKYTREDNIIYGYTLHIEGICVDPNLVTLYQSLDRAGRSSLPALYGLQPLGRAIGNEILFSIRDTGFFMDPRAEKDWWQGAR